MCPAKPRRAAQLRNLKSTERARQVAILKLECETIPNADLKVDLAYDAFEDAALDYIDEMASGPVSQIHNILQQLRGPGARLKAITQARLFLLGDRAPRPRYGKITRPRLIPNMSFTRTLESMLTTKTAQTDPFVIDHLYEIMSAISPGYPILGIHHDVHEKFSPRQFDFTEFLDGVVDPTFKNMPVGDTRYMLPEESSDISERKQDLAKLRRMVRRLNVALAPKTFQIARTKHGDITIERLSDRPRYIRWPIV